MQKLSGMLPPASGGPARQLVVLLHGYGADGNDLIDLGRHWQAVLPEALFVSPNAPERCADNAAGYQWFPIDLGRTIRVVGSGAAAARQSVVDLLEEAWMQTGLTAHDTVLCGFSQGAMMALHTGLSLPQTLRGIISFSGALVPPEGFEAGLPARPPVCIIHGELDQVVEPHLSREAAATLVAHGYDVSEHVSPGIGHGISPDGLEFATRFLVARMAAASS